MSVVVWDGNYLAADKRASFGSLIRTATKIFRLNNSLVGYVGDLDAGEELLAWFKDGQDPAKFPLTQRDKDNWVGLLVVKSDRSLLKYERTPYPIKIQDRQYAIGSGRDFAYAAMYCGRTAVEAVNIACIFDSTCGNGVDVLSFEEPLKIVQTALWEGV